MQEVPTKAGTKLVKVREINDLPTFAGFAVSVGHHRGTLHRWADENPEFKDAYKVCKELQERFLMINGLNGLANSTMTVFTLKNVSGWRDKHEVEQTTTVNQRLVVDYGDGDDGN